MKISEKIFLTQEELAIHGPINVVILGDSVSHGCLVHNIDYENVYWNRLKKRLNALRDFVPVNMICASISGTTANASVSRLEKQVLNHDPDMVIVCFGLNDVNGSLEDFLAALREIFGKALASGAEVIYLSPNMLNTYVAEDTEARYLEYAAKTAAMQNEGRMDRYIASAVALAREMGVTVCDCYAAWKRLAETEDTTMLLANRINHPTREMHALFADALFEAIMADAPAENGGGDSTKPSEADEAGDPAEKHTKTRKTPAKDCAPA